jgi:hypothetical protein
MEDKNWNLDGYLAFCGGSPCEPPEGLDADQETNWRDGWHEAKGDSAEAADRAQLFRGFHREW